ncbi:MAG: hypothetical protein M0Q88_00920 [Bacilli bacterium]|nr:hypothetical protein [Bacilli bacterium]
MKTEFKSSSNINVKNGFTSASNIDAPSNDLNTNFLKLRLDTETGRYIEVDQEVGQDFITLHLRAAKGNILDSTTINITGGVRVTSLELTDNILTITNSDHEEVSCDLTPLLSDKVDRNPDIIGATKTKITYDSKGLVTGGADLSASDIPSLPANKIIENPTHRFVTDAEKSFWTSKSDFSGNYNDLENKPLINNVEIKGNISLEDLNIKNFSGDYGDLSNKPIIPTKVSQLENDANFATLSDIPKKISELEDADDYAKLTDIPNTTSSLINDSGFITETDIPAIPAKLSELDNDSGYITENELPDIPTNISAFTNDAGYLTSTGLPDIPSHTSDLINDAGYITENDIPYIPQDLGDLTNDAGYAKVIDIPTDTSDLNNNSGYITGDALPTKTSQLENDDGFITLEDIPNIPAKLSDLDNDTGFITSEDLPENISELYNDAGYITVEDLPDISSFKTINNEEITGIGNISVQVPLVDEGINQNIKTINNQSILGAGTIDIQEPDVNKEYVDEELSKKQDLIDADNKLDYSLIDNTPEIPNIPDITIQGGVEEVDKYISEISIDSTDKHKIIVRKADLPQRFSGNYDDLTNKPVIPAKTSDLINDNDFATMSDIPVKVSDLENDAEFITLANIPTDLSSFNDDVGFALEEDIPTNVSELINDAEFITAEDIPYIPVKISDLTNDTGFITKYVNDLVNYKSTEDLNVLLEDKVDKEDGYSLTKNNLTDELKENYDDAYQHSLDAPDLYEPKNTNIQEHIIDQNNPHNITKATVNLENVDNVKQATKTEFDNYVNVTNSALGNKVPKERQIIGIDLVDNITITEFKTALGLATDSLSGLMSPQDKKALNDLVALFEDNPNEVVDTINEILAIFENYPEGEDIINILAGKVDKIEGYGLTQNDYDDSEKNKVQEAYAHSQEDHAPSDAQKNVQSDWNQTDTNADDFIKNKPAIEDIPDITIQDGDAEPGKYISQIEVDESDKHKINVTKADLPEVPEISTDIETDASIDNKTVSPKAVVDYVDQTISDIDIPTKISDLDNDEDFITKDYVDTVHFNLDELIPEVGSSYWLSESDIINEVFFGDSVLFNTFVNKTIRISVFCDGGSGGGSDLFIYLTSTVSGDITRYIYQRVTPSNKTYTVSLLYSEIETGWKWLTSYDANSGGGGVTDHNDLTGRDTAESHPMSAITDLSTGEDPYLDQKLKTTDEPEFAGISVTSDWKITADTEKLKLQQNNSGVHTDVMQVYLDQAPETPNAKVKIKAKTEIEMLDFGGW